MSKAMTDSPTPDSEGKMEHAMSGDHGTEVGCASSGSADQVPAWAATERQKMAVVAHRALYGTAHAACATLPLEPADPGYVIADAIRAFLVKAAAPDGLRVRSTVSVAVCPSCKTSRPGEVYDAEQEIERLQAVPERVRNRGFDPYLSEYARGRYNGITAVMAAMTGTQPVFLDYSKEVRNVDEEAVPSRHHRHGRTAMDVLQLMNDRERPAEEAQPMP